MFSLVHGIFSGGFASLHWLRNPAHRILRRDNARGFRALRKEQLWQFRNRPLSTQTLSRLSRPFSSEDFARFVCSEVGVEFGSFSVSGDTSAEFTATTERTVPAERVPDIARKFVGNGVAMTQVDTVSAPAADGSRTVSTEVKVNGVPVSAQATQHLIPEGDKTRLDATARFPAPSRWWARRLQPLLSRRLAAC